jgi:hypothetical protein
VLPEYRELMAQASAQTGLTDFGGDSFREGLEILVRDLGAQARLNATGAAVIYPRIVRGLAQRLQVEDWYRRHPEIDEVEVRSPVFGVGLPRTGSTALSMLLAQDPNRRFIRRWESGEPCPPPATVTGPDPRRQHDIETVGTRRHVPEDGPDGPMECLDIMGLDFKTQIYIAFGRIPTYSDWLLDADLETTYRYERRVLKLLSWQQPNRPWHLKTPMHVLYIPQILAAFPDARFVMTHRDPTDVLLSVAELYADVHGNFTDEVDDAFIGSANFAMWSTGMDRVVAFREANTTQLFYDIDFRAMQSDPIAEVRGLYAWLGEPVSDEFASGMASWWEHSQLTREPSPKVDAARFGYDLDEVRPRFADYTAHAHQWTRHDSQTAGTA